MVKVNIPSYLVTEKDIIEVKDKSKEHTLIVGSIGSKERDKTDHIQMDEKNKTAKLLESSRIFRSTLSNNNGNLI